MYYRVAIQVDSVPTWQWKSTALSSLNALFQWLQFYRAFPHDRLRIFSSSSREEMNEQLLQANHGLLSTSVTATQFLQERRLHSSGASWGTSDPGAQEHQEIASIAVSTESWSNESSRAVLALDGRSRSSVEKRRLELESGPGADHEVWSHSSDVAVMHPVAGLPVGWEQVRASWEQFAQLCSGGEVTLRDPLFRVSTDLAYVVGTNAAQVTVAGEPISFELRVTNIFRREAGVWKSVHQHVDVVPALQAILDRLQAASGQPSS